VSSGCELVYTTELYIDRRRHCLPCAAIWCVRLEEFCNGVVRPLVAPPIEGDQCRTAGEEDACDDEELPVEGG